MAMRLKVKEIATQLGMKNAAQLAKATGLNLTSCYQLWNGTAEAITFQSLNTLCNTLRTHPGLLFDYTPDVDAASSPEPAPARDEAAPKVKRSRPAGQKAKTRAAAVTAG
jgi:DNA-binding Xre family transcriptional regulator